MGKRSKDKKQTIYVGSDNKVLKDLMTRKQQILKTNEEQSSRWIKLFQSDYEKYKNNPLFKRGQYIKEIASAIGLDSLSVSWSLSPFLTDDELERAAKESRLLYQERIDPMDFNSTLTDEQIKSLLPMMNKYVFKEAQTLESVKRWLKRETEFPVPVKNNGNLALMLRTMSDCGLICSNWAQVAENSRVFVSKTKKIISASNLTTSLNRLLLSKNQDINKQQSLIENSIRGVKG